MGKNSTVFIKSLKFTTYTSSIDSIQMPYPIELGNIRKLRIDSVEGCDNASPLLLGTFYHANHGGAYG